MRHVLNLGVCWQAYVSLAVTDGLFRDAARLGWAVQGRFESEV